MKIIISDCCSWYTLLGDQIKTTRVFSKVFQLIREASKYLEENYEITLLKNTKKPLISAMGYFATFRFTHKDKIFTCDRDGFDNEINLKKLVNDLLLFRHYIVDMLAFLKIDRSDNDSQWPKWTEIHSNCFCRHNGYCINMDNECIEIMKNSDSSYVCINLDNKPENTPQFTRFLNIRFQCDKIWKKHNLPKDIINFIENNYF